MHRKQAGGRVTLDANTEPQVRPGGGARDNPVKHASSRTPGHHRFQVRTLLLRGRNVSHWEVARWRFKKTLGKLHPLLTEVTMCSVSADESIGIEMRGVNSGHIIRHLRRRPSIREMASDRRVHRATTLRSWQEMKLL